MLLPFAAQAQAAHDHSATYHAVWLDTGYGRHDGQDSAHWDADGWVGGDTHKLWLKSEGEVRDGDTEGEVWVLYSRNVSTFWNAQIGVRHDFGDADRTYLAVGVNGLASYFFETQAHLLVRGDGAIGARLRQENDLLLTNRLILSPSIEVNAISKADPQHGTGSGLTDATAALQLRYEINRRFAPYVQADYQRKLGETADRARAAGKSDEETRVTLGIRWLF
ncbi:copper resistance protein B [Asticcacaulis sp. AND118]|uniref:copper resistance protein B n=1 Tax=Asticcacaulis sp. AND118 TaxID=2840468 RepID=UPI001CFF6473|nr:copper resistance protein B [Asticcacaulis sp. AND118]UDF05268.1 copper resistance protein B [Asticcacaulis sp. AND118]